MTSAQLDRIGELYAELGKPWHVADRPAMLEAITDEAAASLIGKLEQELSGP